MSEAIIFGYFGYGNLGDETNLRELIATLRRKFPKMKLTVMSATPEETSARFQVSTIYRFDVFKIGSAFRRADFLIGGGGSLFQDRTSFRSLLYYVSLLFMAKWSGLKILLYGQGFGPIRSCWGKDLARRALSACRVITVRDRLALIALINLEAQPGEVYLTAEPLLALSAQPAEAVIRYWQSKNANEGERRLGIILKRDLRCPVDWEIILAELKRRYQLELFLIMLDAVDRDYQIELAVKLNANFLAVTDDWEQCQRILGGLELVLSARLHGLVAAATQAVPCLGLAADPKIDGFCLQWGIPFLSLTPDLDPFSLYRRVSELLEQTAGERERLKKQKDFWQARALENQVILKKFLTERG